MAACSYFDYVFVLDHGMEVLSTKKKKLVIGVTGIPASGKSTVASYVAKKCHGQVINADKVGHAILRKAIIQRALVRRWGKNVLYKNELSRKKIANIVFSSEKERLFLNKTLWPVLSQCIRKMINESKSTVIILDAAVLFEAGWDKYCSNTICVVAQEKQIKKRTRNWSIVKRIIDAQFSQEKKASLAVCSIKNNGKITDLYKNIDKIVS